MTSMTFWNMQRIGASSARALPDIAQALSGDYLADIYTFVELTNTASKVLDALTDAMSHLQGRTLTWSWVEAGDGWDVYGMISSTAVNAPALQFYDIDTPRLFGKRRLGMTRDPGTGTTIFVYHAPPREKLGQLNLGYILQALTATSTWTSSRMVIAGDFNAEDPPAALFASAQITAGSYVTTQFNTTWPLDYFVCSPLVTIADTWSTRFTSSWRKLSDHLPVWIDFT